MGRRRQRWDVCDLLIDVTTTERVLQVIQDIDNVAYKELYIISEAQGHSDNSAAGYTVAVTLENANNETVIHRGNLTVA